MSTFKISILGFGPTAAFIARACKDFAGKYADVSIFTNDATPKFPAGAFYFHFVPSTITEPLRASRVYYNYLGNSKEYLMKQWGKFEGISSSFGQHQRESIGFNPEECFRPLLGEVDIILKSFTDDQIHEMCSEYDIVFMTFPFKSMSEHYSKYIVRFPVLSWDFPEGIIGNRIIYNGASGSIVRLSVLFNKVHVEYTSDYIIQDKLQGSAKISILHDIHPDSVHDRYIPNVPDNLILVGRYAEYNRTRLSHEAYTIAASAIRRILNVG